MILTRKNKLAGRPLSGYPLVEDERTGIQGRKWGYCSGCNEPIIVRTIELRELAGEYSDFTSKRFREPLKHKLIRWMGGEIRN